MIVFFPSVGYVMFRVTISNAQCNASVCSFIYAGSHRITLRKMVVLLLVLKRTTQSIAVQVL